MGRYDNAWRAVANSPTVVVLANSATELISRLPSEWPLYGAWLQDLQDRIKEVKDQLSSNAINQAQAQLKLATVLREAFVKARGLGTPPDAAGKILDAYYQPYTKVMRQRNALLDQISKGALLTADWTVTRDPQAPDLSTITAVFEKSYFKATQDFTVNFSSSFYHSAPKDVDQYRSTILAGQYDIPLSSISSGTGGFVLSLAGRYEYIPNDTKSTSTMAAMAARMAETDPTKISATAALPVAKGHIGLFQAKLTIPMKGSGVKIPISFTVANRTEIIKETDVRANIGISLDLDSLVAKAIGR